MNLDCNYRNTQRSPLCLLLYALGIIFLGLSWLQRNEPVVQAIFPIVSVFMFVLAASFHSLTVEDEVDQLSIHFGPLPIFRRTVRYQDIESVELGRTTILDGWGIHMSLRGGWVWNLWGRNCAVLNLQGGILRVGSDDAERLVDFLNAQIQNQRRKDV